jgi:hypothetical protein
LWVKWMSEANISRVSCGILARPELCINFWHSCPKSGIYMYSILYIYIYMIFANAITNRFQLFAAVHPKIDCISKARRSSHRMCFFESRAESPPNQVNHFKINSLDPNIPNLLQYRSVQRKLTTKIPGKTCDDFNPSPAGRRAYHRLRHLRATGLDWPDAQGRSRWFSFSEMAEKWQVNGWKRMEKGESFLVVSSARAVNPVHIRAQVFTYSD